MTQKKTPTLFIVLRVIGFLLIACGITLIIVGATKKVPDMGDSGWFESETSRDGFIFGGISCCVFSLPILVASFVIPIAKAGMKITKQIHEETKDDLMYILNNTTQMMGNARQAFTRELQSQETKCTNCGAPFEDNDTSCKYCGNQRK